MPSINSAKTISDRDKDEKTDVGALSTYQCMDNFEIEGGLKDGKLRNEGAASAKEPGGKMIQADESGTNDHFYSSMDEAGNPQDPLLRDGAKEGTSDEMSEGEYWRYVREFIGFMVAGLLNNSAYVIMMAGAKNIDPGLVGVVYVCNTLPILLVQMTLPYWFHLVSYNARMVLISVFMTASFLMVSYGGHVHNTSLQLVGIAIGSLQQGIGEPMYLSLTTFFGGRRSVAAWSSGSGIAGLFGYAWVVVCTVLLQQTFSATLLYALIIPVLFLSNYVFLLGSPTIGREAPFQVGGTGEGRKISTEEGDESDVVSKMTGWEKFQAWCKLWPYMFPLFLVYFSEYAMQSGVWASIGFPVTSKEARNHFYQYSNFAYQAGVFISRSSGLVLRANMTALWIMPIIQTGLLVFFLTDAYLQFWYDNGLIGMAFLVGCLGGAVYVGGFALIGDDVPKPLKEFSMGAAAIAMNIGVVGSTIAAIFIQRGIYEYYGIEGDQR